MYELNTVFAPPADRASFAADCEIARRYHQENGATEILLVEFISGMGAGSFVWSLHFATLDEAASYMRNTVALRASPTSEAGEVRSRHPVVGRGLSRVVNHTGERAGPCMVVTASTSEKPVPAEDNKYGLDLFVANGAKGATTIVGMEGEGVGGYYTGIYGESFEQIFAATEVAWNDDRFLTAINDTGMKLVNRHFADVS